MSWLIVFVFVILNYSIANMVVFSNGPFHIFLNFRKLMEKIHSQLYELVTCMICFPTYSAALLSFIALIIGVNFTPFTLVFAGSHPILTVLFDALFGSGSAWLIHNVEEFFERSNNVQYEDEHDNVLSLKNDDESDK